MYLSMFQLSERRWLDPAMFAGILVSNTLTPACGGSDPEDPSATPTTAPLESPTSLPIESATSTPDTTPSGEWGTPLPAWSVPGGILPSFPGAEGFGSHATGGRGGRVIYVTNLAASGEGSLQHALDQDVPRYILFKVSGVIEGSPQLNFGNVTIAGQSSPGGVILRQFHTTEEPYCDGSDPRCIRGSRHADNWILRHLRLRPDGEYDDGLRLRYTRNVMVDHVSIANATDEAVEISYSSDVTIQHSMLAETVGDHAHLGGMLINYSNPTEGFELGRFSIHHNTWNRIVGRMPELSRESPGAGESVMEIELSNNLLWDPGFYIDVNNTTISASTEGEPVYYAMNWIGNLGFARSSSEPEAYPYGMMSIAPPVEPGLTSTWFQDNHLNLYPERSDYDLLYCCNDFARATPAPTPDFAIEERHNFPLVSYTPSGELIESMVTNVGAFPRDPMDRRLLQPLIDGAITPMTRSVNHQDDALALDFDPANAPQAPSDRDNDGMPDTWEVEHGLNPDAEDHNGLDLSLTLAGIEGYTNLECYLNELAVLKVSTP